MNPLLLEHPSEFCAYQGFFTFSGERLPTTTAPPPTTTQATTIPARQPTPTPKPRVPEKPENVVATARSDTEILLTWEPPKATNGEILEYRIFYNVINPSDGKLSCIIKSDRFSLMWPKHKCITTQGKRFEVISFA